MPGYREYTSYSFPSDFNFDFQLAHCFSPIFGFFAAKRNRPFGACREPQVRIAEKAPTAFARQMCLRCSGLRSAMCSTGAHLAFVLFLFLSGAVLGWCGEEYVEELMLRPLPHGPEGPGGAAGATVLADFVFTTRQSAEGALSPLHFSEDGQGSSLETYTLFPKSLVQIVRTYNVAEFRVTFGQGRWLGQWGTPLRSPSPAGVQIWAWIPSGSSADGGVGSSESGSSVSEMDVWTALLQTLSGLLGTSLNTIGVELTGRPTSPTSFPSSHGRQDGNFSVFMGALPREAVCTENFTPWLKLKPCRGQRGLAALLDPLRMYHAFYNSMELSVVDHGEYLELVQTLTMVLPARSKKKHSSLDSGFAVRDLFRVDGGWSRVRTCPLASKSLVYLVAPQEVEEGERSSDSNDIRPNFTLPFPKRNEIWRVWEISATSGEIPAGLWQQLKSKGAFPLPVLPVQVSTVVSGSSDFSGTLHTSVRRMGSDRQPLRFSFFEIFPWFVRLYFHSMEIRLNGRIVDNFGDVAENFYIRPAEDRGVPSVLEFDHVLYPNDTLQLTMQFERAFLHFEEYLPDPHRGYDLPWAYVTFSPFAVDEPVKFEEKNVPSGRVYSALGGEFGTLPPIFGAAVLSSGSRAVSLRVTSSVVQFLLPTPDFSMPFNAITLTCTVIAIFYGTMQVAVLRRHTEEEEGKADVVSEGLAFYVLKRMYRAVMRWWDNRKRKSSAETRNKKQV